MLIELHSHLPGIGKIRGTTAAKHGMTLITACLLCGCAGIAEQKARAPLPKAAMQVTNTVQPIERLPREIGPVPIQGLKGMTARLTLYSGDPPEGLLYVFGSGLNKLIAKNEHCNERFRVQLLDGIGSVIESQSVVPAPENYVEASGGKRELSFKLDPNVSPAVAERISRLKVEWGNASQGEKLDLQSAASTHPNFDPSVTNMPPPPILSPSVVAGAGNVQLAPPKSMSEASASVATSVPAPKLVRSSDVYIGEGDSHWISENHDGAVIELEDGSMWEVSPVDRVDSILWLASSSIKVVSSNDGLFPYLLINTDDGEKVEAKLLRQ